MINKIFAEDCFITMSNIIEKNIKVNNIITSPFYNTGRGSKCHKTQKSRDNYEGRYDVHLDNMTDDEYIEFTLKLFDNGDFPFSSKYEATQVGSFNVILNGLISFV